MGLLGAIGKVAKFAAPLTPWGAPAALAIGAGGGLLDAADDGENPLMGMVKGAAPAAAGQALSAIGSRAMGTPSVAPAAPGLDDAGMAADAVGAAAPGARGGIGSRVLGWAKENPEVAAQILGTGVQAYGAYKEGQATDRLADLREEDLRRGWGRQDNLDPIMARLIGRLTAPTAAGAY